MAYETSTQPFLAFDLGSWHGGCSTVEIVPNPATGVPWAYCPSCRCTAQLDLVAPHITPESSKETREHAS